MRQINASKWGWVKKAIPIFVLTGLTFIFFSDVLFQNKIFGHRDLSRFFYPLREFSAHEFLSGRIPLWNPHIHCGSPHLAELQTCVFYPLSIIYLLFPYPHAFNYFIIIHILLAGLFTYILMREWGHSGYASFLSAVVFMFSGYMISVINLLASLASVIWLPLVILFYERALKKDWVKNSIITGIFMALMFLGGEPVILYATFFILIILSLTLYSRERFQTVPYRSRQGCCFLLAFLVFLGLASFQILPFLEFLRNSSRASMDFNEASTWSLPVYALLDLFVPYLSESDYIYKDYWTRQSWLLVYYMGIATFIFAFISLKLDSTKRRRVIFYILAAGLVISFGRYTPVYYFLYKFMPGFKLSRYPIKFFFIAAFSLSVLAGMGFEYYFKNARTNIKLDRFLKGILTAGFILSFFYLILEKNFSWASDFLQNFILKIFPDFVSKKNEIEQLIYVNLFNIKRAFLFFMLFSVLIYAGTVKKIKLNLLMPVIIALSIFDIFTSTRGVYQNMDKSEFLQPAENAAFLKKDNALFRIFNSPTTLRRNMFVPERDYFDGMNALKERLISNLGISSKIYDAYGYGSLYNRRNEEIIDIIIKSKSPSETNLLNLLNVKYVISPKDFEADGYMLVRKAEKANIYENLNFLPRAFLADRAVVVKDEKKILEKLKSRDFNPEEEVILEGDFSFTGRWPLAAGRSFVNILKYEPNHVEIETETNAPRFLVLSDTYYPGWKVYVDGKPDKIYRADYILRAVYLEPGNHIVKFIYGPFSFKIGAIITLVTIFVLIYMLFFRQLRV